MQVAFTKHAAERFQQRLNICVKAGQKVSIDSAFTLVKTYNHTQTNRKMHAYCYNDTTQKIVLVVDALAQCVITVYLGSLEDAYGTNMVAACYAVFAKKQPYMH